MKLSLAVSALVLSSCSAFAPASNQRPSTRMQADATATETYTFTKSEEIFAEAQTVRTLYSLSHKHTHENTLITVNARWSQ